MHRRRCFSDSYDEDTVCQCRKKPRCGWTTRHPENWSGQEVVQWVGAVLAEYGVKSRVSEELHARLSSLTGPHLLAMTLHDFRHLDPSHGPLLFTVLHHMLSTGNMKAIPPEAQSRSLTPTKELGRHFSSQSMHDREPLHSVCRCQCHRSCPTYLTARIHLGSPTSRQQQQTEQQRPDSKQCNTSRHFSC